MLHLRTLGQVDLRGPDGRPVRALLTQPRRLALLAYLALARPRGLQRRDRLLTLFWPEIDDDRARAALSQALHVLRRGLGAGVVVTRGSEEVGLDLARLVVDADQFEQAADGGALTDADRLYQGELLPGFHLGDAPGFDEWLEANRARLRDRAVAVARTGADRAEAAGEREAAVAWLARLLELAPLEEPALQRLVALRAALGDKAGALRSYEEFAARLARDLEVTPGPATEALARQLRADRAPGMPRATPRSPEAPPAAAHPAPPASTAPTPATPRRRDRHRLVIAGLVVVALLAVGVLARHQARVKAGAERVAVLPFVVRGDTGLGYLREGLVDLLATKLDALGAFQTVDPAALLAELARAGHGGDTVLDPARAALIAREFGAGYFVLGRLVATGGRIDLAATLYSADGTRRVTVTAGAAAPAGLAESVDRLARELVATRWSAPADRLQRLAVTSSADPAALRSYLEGERAYRTGAYAAARDAFLAAVEADSTFALAQYRLSVAAGWLADNEHYVGGAERALALGDRLTAHDRALVEAHLAYITGSSDEAERRYRELTRLYPDDAEAWYNLGEVLFHSNPLRGRPPGEATEPFRRSTALLDGSLEARSHLVQLQLLAGDRDGALPEIDAVIAGYPPEEPRTRIYRVLRALLLGDTSIAFPLIAATPVTDLWVLGRSIAVLTPDLRAADSVAGLLVNPARAPADRALGHLLRAELELARGRWRASREEVARLALLDEALAEQLEAYYATLPWVPLGAAEIQNARDRLAAWRPHPRPPPVPVLGSPVAQDREAMQLFYEALLTLRGGDSTDARLVTGRLERLLADRGSAPALASLAPTARSAARLAAGDPAGALATLDSVRQLPGSIPATPQLSHALQRFLRAEALAAMDRHEEALGWYRSFVVLFGFDLAFRGPGLLGEAEQLEALGRRDEARERYQAFLNLWSESDPRFEPLLRRARLALTARPGE